MKSKDQRHATLSKDITALEDQLAKLSIIERSCKMEADNSRRVMTPAQYKAMAGNYTRCLSNTSLLFEVPCM